MSINFRQNICNELEIKGYFHFSQPPHDKTNKMTFSPSEDSDQHTVQNVCQNRRPYRTQTLFQFSASPAPILGTTENATFAHFMKKSMHLKTGFLSDYQILFLLLNGPQIETSVWFNRSISIDLWRQKVATRWYCSLPLKQGNLQRKTG